MTKISEAKKRVHHEGLQRVSGHSEKVLRGRIPEIGREHESGNNGGCGFLMENVGA